MTPTGEYDAVLVVSFGGPEGEADVLPFLDNVMAGRPVPDAVKARIAARYRRFGGVSPINVHTRAFIDALDAELKTHGPALPIYWGNRNWHPFLKDTAQRMAADGIRYALVYLTSLFSSYSGCRQYREDLYRAMDGVADAPTLHKLRSGYNHPGFIDAMAARLRGALDTVQDDAPVLFTAHSLPVAMARHADYEDELREACALVAEAAGVREFDLAFQSNNARTGVPWLTPTVEDALDKIADAGHAEVVVAPIGFVCDHMEVVLDLDVEAREHAERQGLRMVRAETVGTHPSYVGMVRDLIVEQASGRKERPSLGSRGPRPVPCAANCCLSGRPGAPLPALCGVSGA